MVLHPVGPNKKKNGVNVASMSKRKVRVGKEDSKEAFPLCKSVGTLQSCNKTSMDKVWCLKTNLKGVLHDHCSKKCLNTDSITRVMHACMFCYINVCAPPVTVAQPFQEDDNHRSSACAFYPLHPDGLEFGKHFQHS